MIDIFVYMNKILKNEKEEEKIDRKRPSSHFSAIIGWFRQPV